jgi:hypothetical protein
MDAARWLLLIHQIPPKPDYFRVKVRRRLQRLGAHPIKNSVYVLPNTEESLEDFIWLAQEIRAEGGEAVVVEAQMVAGMTDEELSGMVHATRTASGHVPPEVSTSMMRPGRTWVTRVGIKVDRMASAWLIRRFIDVEARFKFVAPKGYVPLPGELRFDMFDAEYTHQGEECTFEVLADRFGLASDDALRAIGEIVHDIDCKDDRYGRPETSGVAALIEAIASGAGDDEARLVRGRALFEDLYRAFDRRDANAPSAGESQTPGDEGDRPPPSPG